MIIAIVLLLVTIFNQISAECGYKNFQEWDAACLKLPKPPIPWGNYRPSVATSAAVSKDCFVKTLNDCTKILQKDIPRGVVIDTSFDPFVLKQEFSSSAMIALHGDLHGDVHSLNAFIRDMQSRGYMTSEDGFKIKDPNFNMVFLGDYTDRGLHGMEVMYAIMRLKMANPSKVFLVRGNHEDVPIISRYGFAQELYEKFSVSSPSNEKSFVQKDLADCLNTLDRFYRSLPVALFIGTTSKQGRYKEFALCCHGGIEVGFDAKSLLDSDKKRQYMKIGTLKRLTHLSSYSDEVQDELRQNIPSSVLGDIYGYDPFDVGFMWNDFHVNANNSSSYNRGRGWAISKSLLTEYLKQNSERRRYSLNAVFRAHQHSGSLTPMMARILNKDDQSPPGEVGVGKLWNRKEHSSNAKAVWPGMVATFLVAPLTPYSIVGFDYNAFGLLKLASRYKNWKLEVVRISKENI